MTLEWIAQGAAVSALLAVVAAVAGKRLGARPAVCHALWLIVVLRLIVPPGMLGQWTLPTPAFLAAEHSVDVPVVPAGSPVDAPGRFAGPVVASGMRASSVLPAGPSASGPIAAPPPAAPFPWRAVLGWIWLAGAIAMALSIIRNVVAARRRLGGARVADRRVRRVVHRIATRLRVTAPRVVAVDGPCAPFVWALGRPRIVVPTTIADALDPDALEAVIVHELAHLKRRDHWVGRALLAASVIHWWNPVYWWARRRIHDYAEQSCDAWVVETLPALRHRYANTLIEVSRIVSKTGSPATAIGMGSVTYHELKRRLHMILNVQPRRGVPTLGAIAIALLGLAASPDVSFGQARPAQPAPPKAPATAEATPPGPVAAPEAPVYAGSVGIGGGAGGASAWVRGAPGPDRLSIRFANGRWKVTQRGTTLTLNPDGSMTSQSDGSARRRAPRTPGQPSAGNANPLAGSRSRDHDSRGTAPVAGAASTPERRVRAADPSAGRVDVIEEEVLEEVEETPEPEEVVEEAPPRASWRSAQRRVIELEREIARLEKLIRELSKPVRAPAPSRGR